MVLGPYDGDRGFKGARVAEWGSEDGFDRVPLFGSAAVRGARAGSTDVSCRAEKLVPWGPVREPWKELGKATSSK